jgi:photosystem II stability/assembly factor-like uncharacterized protein
MGRPTWVALACGLGGAVAAFAAAPPAAPPPVPAPVETLLQGVAHDALFAISFDGASGVAAGAPGRVLDSADGGKTWSQDKGYPSPLAVLGAVTLDGRTIAVGQMGTVVTREKGAWVLAKSGTTERLMNVGLNHKGLAVAVGAFGTVVRSGDAGKTWQVVSPDWKPYLTEDQLVQGIQPHLSAVSVSDTGVITVAGEFGLILRSRDDGATWKAVSSSKERGTEAIFAMDLRDDGIGYAVGQDGLILRSRDGGATWSRLAGASKANLLGVRSVGDKVVISAMHDLLTSSDGGKSWRRVRSPDVQTGWYSGIGIAGDAFLAVGYTGRIIRISI